MTSFFDTSALIKHYIEEAGSEAVSELMNDADEVFVSEITIIECFSTLKRLLLERQIDEKSFHYLKDELRHDFRFFSQIAVEDALKYCETLIDRYQLKTLDSVQLASAVYLKKEIHSFICCDVKLSTAAGNESFEVINPLRK
jgi:hypothetical protein